MREQTESQPLDNHELAEAVKKQAFELWINPETERRAGEGNLPENFSVSMAQILFSIGGPPVVRLNDEVKAIGRIKLNKSVKKGDLIRYKDIKSIHSFKLIPEERDFGHITLVRFPDQWIVYFSFIYDISKSKELLKMGEQFLKSASNELKNENHRPLIENLSIAAENCAKARLILLPNERIRKSKTHHTIKSEVNIFASTSNVIPTNFKTAFNRILDLRNDARYDPTFEIDKKEAQVLHKAVLTFTKEVRILLATHRK